MPKQESRGSVVPILLTRSDGVYCKPDGAIVWCGSCGGTMKYWEPILLMMHNNLISAEHTVCPRQ